MPIQPLAGHAPLDPADGTCNYWLPAGCAGAGLGPAAAGAGGRSGVLIAAAGCYLPKP